MSELVHMPSQPVARQQINVGEMMQAFIEKGVTPENVAAFEQLIKLHIGMEQRSAEKEFNAAFVALQSEMPNVKAKRIIPGNNGEVRSTFAAFEDIMDQVRPFLTKHGFTISFDSEVKENRMTAICKLRHAGGHGETNQFTVRVGSGPPKSSEAQGDGAANTYAKRAALCACLNIVIDHDSDASAEGAPISPEQAKDLADRATAAGIDHARLLKLAGAKSFDEILSEKFAIADEFVRKAAPADPVKDLKAKIWAALATVRGSKQSWDEATAWMRSKSILGPAETVSALPQGQLVYVLEQVQKFTK